MKISEMHKNRIPGPGVERFCVLAWAGRTWQCWTCLPEPGGGGGWRPGEGAWQMGCWAGNECAVLSSLYNVLYILEPTSSLCFVHRVGSFVCHRGRGGPKERYNHSVKPAVKHLPES